MNGEEVLSLYAAHLHEHWEISASLERLDGEYDLNLLATQGPASRYIVKVMRQGCAPELVDMQLRALAHIHHANVSVPAPSCVTSLDGNQSVTIVDQDGAERIMWVLEYVEGILYSQFKPKDVPLNMALGKELGRMHQALHGFDHHYLHRTFNWNLMQADWISGHIHQVENSGRRALLNRIIETFQLIKPELLQSPAVAIHGDVNDNNIVVQAVMGASPVIAGFIDFGDMFAAPRVCDLAIAGAYVVLDHPRPAESLIALVTGFHAEQPLSEQEVDLLLPLLQLRLAVSVVTSLLLSAQRPDDPYLLISQVPAWRFLESDTQWASLGLRLRVACNLPVVNSAPDVLGYLDQQRGQFKYMFGTALDEVPVVSLSVADTAVPQNPFMLSRIEAVSLADSTDTLLLGGYAEPRLVYTDEAFRAGPYPASARRSVHLGVDVFAPVGTCVRAALEGSVVAVEDRQAPLDYGGLVVMKHQTDIGSSFYSLYGHLDPQVCESLSIGQQVLAGETIGKLGSESCNGGWASHLHLQIALTLVGLESDWPGVADPDDRSYWTALCPNPAALLNLPDSKTAYQPLCDETLRSMREDYFSSNLALSYRKPILLLRGWQHYLFDQWGRTYLDAYNNVPHVGHANPEVNAAMVKQLGQLNTNTRYLHPIQIEFAEAVLSTLPEKLSVCFCVNSGSEANELALRLARARTGGKDIITPNHGYHGNTTGAIDISAYKFNAKGGVGQPDWVHLVDIPDDYRGRYRRGECDTAANFASQVDLALQAIDDRGGKLAGFIAETFPSVGGQIIPPDGYLIKVYEKIRAAGGVCIADEVQTGLGRLGDHFYGIEQQNVEPDIVVLGKPIGNGHPLGVVVTTRAIADCFAQGPEFFSTFGGSTVSCVVGKTVLDIVKREKLQENARLMGNRLLVGLRLLQEKHGVVGDVRGMGLFIGVEFVEDREIRSPATDLAAHIVNKLRHHRILTGLEGPDNNVLKIRPPLTIQADDIDMILEVLGNTLEESLSVSSLV